MKVFKVVAAITCLVVFAHGVEYEDDYEDEVIPSGKAAASSQVAAKKEEPMAVEAPEQVSKLVRSMSPLFIGKEEEGSNIVKLKSSSNSIFSCEFKHTTKGDSGKPNTADKKQQQQQAFAGIHRDVESILGKLSGICIRKTLDYWKYELCFDSKITQSHGRDSFLLGTYSGMEGIHQLYEEGTLCEALPGHVGRESRVEFVCDSTLRLISVEEVSTCSYKVYVSTPVVCGHPDFLQNTRTIPGKGSRTQSGPPKDEWFLEITEKSGGQVVCSVTALKTNADLKFQEFELSVSAVNMDVELKQEHDVARGSSRRQLSKVDKQYAVQRSNENTRIAMISGRTFQGDLTHAMLQAVPIPLQEDV